MSNFLKIEIQTASVEELEILTATLSENHFYAFEQEENSLIAYIKEEDFNEEKFGKLLPFGEVYQMTMIADKNWNQQWESELKPVIIDDFAAIRAIFHAPIAHVKHELIITPKMSFGTGHHATTHLMVEYMEKIDFRNKTVLDFGTGTGVLAILAEKLGASKIMAIDYDEWSINNALENIEANNCEKISVEKRDSAPLDSPVDIVAANINLSVLTENSSSITRVLMPGGLLLISGFLFTDEKAMENVFNEKYFVKRSASVKDDWLAILFQKL